MIYAFFMFHTVGTGTQCLCGVVCSYVEHCTLVTGCWFGLPAAGFETMSRKCLYAKLMRSGDKSPEMKQWQHEHASLLSPCRLAGWAWWVDCKHRRIVITTGRYFL